MRRARGKNSWLARAIARPPCARDDLRRAFAAKSLTRPTGRGNMYIININVKANVQRACMA